MPRLDAYFQENDHKNAPQVHAPIQRKPKVPLPISSMAKLKYNAFIKHLKGRNQETKSILLKNITKPDKVKRFLFKLLPKSIPLPNPMNYMIANTNSPGEIHKRILRGKAKKPGRAEADPYLILRLGGLKTSNAGEPSKIKGGGDDDEDKIVGDRDIHIKNRVRYKVRRRQDTGMAFKLPSKPASSAFNLFYKKKVMTLTQTKRISHYSSNGNDGRSSENPKLEEQRPTARKEKKVTSVKAMRKAKAEAGEGDALWKKNILIGKRCQLKDFKGALQHNEKGNRMKMTKTQLTSETMGLSFHMGEEESDLPKTLTRLKRSNQFLDLASEADGGRGDSQLPITPHAKVEEDISHSQV